MADRYGSDFITISDEDGTEYELEVLTTVEYNGFSYLAVIPAADDKNDLSALDVCILKSVTEDGEDILCAVEDEAELDAVNTIIMEQLFSDESTDNL